MAASRKSTSMTRAMGLALLIMVTNYISFHYGLKCVSTYINIHGAQQQSPDENNNNNDEGRETFVDVDAPFLPSAVTPSLRGADAIATSDAVPPKEEEEDDAATSDTNTNKRIAKPVFNKPSPELWDDIPIVKPILGHKTVLVTGAAGFIASHVANALLERGDEVIVVDEVNDYYDVKIKEGNLKLLSQTAQEMAEKHSDGSKKAEDLLTIYRVDINDQTKMKEIYAKHNPKWVCHLAARAGVRPSIQDPLLYVRANVLGTTNMLEYSRQNDVVNTVVASSSSVYGESQSTYFSEAEIVDRPVSPYAATKRSVEIMSYTYNHMYNMNVTNLRFFTVYGPRGRPDMAPYKFISRVTKGEQIEKYGDGSTSRDYTYVDDIVNGVLRAIDRPYSYQIFNLGKGSGTKLNDFIALVEEYVGKKANIKQVPAKMGDVPFTNADVSKAHRLLGYESNVTMEEGIKKTVEWYQGAFGEDGKLDPRDGMGGPPEDKK